MSRRHLLALGVATLSVAACSSGDIKIAPSTSVTDSNNTTNARGGGRAANPCGSYVTSGGQTIQGDYGGTDCTYSPSFADAGKNITVDLTIPVLPNGGVHIFQGSLFIGKTYHTQAELAAAGLTKGGDDDDRRRVRPRRLDLQ